MRIVVLVSLLVVAVIHLLPVYGALGSRELTALYGIPELTADTRLLMRHRALMFGVIGVFLASAAFQPQLHTAALLVGAGSVLSFLALAAASAPYNQRLASVVKVDFVAIALLVIAAMAHVVALRSR